MKLPKGLSSPGPKIPPTPGNSVRERVCNPLNHFLSITRQYGDIICYRPTPDTAYLINHPDYIHHVLEDNSRNYSKDTYSNQAFKKAVGPGLINFEGDDWLHRRRLMQPAFHHTRLEPLDGMIVEAVKEMLDRWQVYCAAGRTINVAREMAALTMTITSRALFGVKLGEAAHTMGEVINGGADLLERPNHPRMQQAVAELAALVDRILGERQRNFEDRGDLLSPLMTAHVEGNGARLDGQKLRHEMMGLLIAGHETTANALTWTFYLLS